LDRLDLLLEPIEVDVGFLPNGQTPLELLLQRVGIASAIFILLYR